MSTPLYLRSTGPGALTGASVDGRAASADESWAALGEFDGAASRRIGAPAAGRRETDVAVLAARVLGHLLAD